MLEQAALAGLRSCWHFLCHCIQLVYRGGFSDVLSSDLQICSDCAPFPSESAGAERNGNLDPVAPACLQETS